MYMRKVILALLAFCSLASFVACNDYETYGDKKEKERKAIRQFLADSSFVVISESQFHAAGNVTNVANKEFVYLDNTGVYMQIVSKGFPERSTSDTGAGGEDAPVIIRKDAAHRLCPD